MTATEQVPSRNLGYATDKQRSIPEPLSRLDLLYRVPYKIGYIDPPWQYEVWSDKGKGRSADKHYKCQPNQFLYDMGIGELMDEDSVLFIWVTEPTQEAAFECLRQWGYTFATTGFTWIKLTKNSYQNANKWSRKGQSLEGYIDRLFNFGQGHWTRANVERCIIATRGKIPKRLVKNVRQLVIEPIRGHSAKPLCVRDRIVTLLGDLPRIEIFASAADAKHGRERGWDLIGNEISGRDIHVDIQEIVCRRDGGLFGDENNAL